MPQEPKKKAAVRLGKHTRWKKTESRISTYICPGIGTITGSLGRYTDRPVEWTFIPEQPGHYGTLQLEINYRLALESMIATVERALTQQPCGRCHQPRRFDDIRKFPGFSAAPFECGCSDQLNAILAQSRSVQGALLRTLSTRYRAASIRLTH